jgi:hypothetical protein
MMLIIFFFPPKPLAGQQLIKCCRATSFFLRLRVKYFGEAPAPAHTLLYTQQAIFFLLTLFLAAVSE